MASLFSNLWQPTHLNESQMFPMHVFPPTQLEDAHSSIYPHLPLWPQSDPTQPGRQKHSTPTPLAAWWQISMVVTSGLIRNINLLATLLVAITGAGNAPSKGTLRPAQWKLCKNVYFVKPFFGGIQGNHIVQTAYWIKGMLTTNRVFLLRVHRQNTIKSSTCP